MPAAIALPATKALQHALREVTEHLARELAAPSAAAPAWNELQWTVARAVAAMHGVSPLLSRRLAWRGPAEWRDFLQSQRQHTALRHVRIGRLLRHIDAGAHERGISVTALKGVALHDLSLYAAGDRPMADIDLLVRPAAVAPLDALLHSLNYERSSAGWREIVYSPRGGGEPAPLGEGAGNVVKIEVHERICEQLAWRITDASAWIFPAHPEAGLHGYDSPAALMMHLLLHAAGSMSRQGLRLLQLHDIALLAARMRSDDWDALLACGTQGQSLWWAFPPLQLTDRYYPARIPEGVLRRLALVCPCWLRRAARRNSLYDVSLSYPWVDAFPALAWSRSAFELCGYVANRVHPRANVIAARERMLQTEPWARRAAWGRLTQGRRLLHWAASRSTASRPTRLATLHALAAAFT
jgi:hypothetical protein